MTTYSKAIRISFSALIFSAVMGLAGCGGSGNSGPVLPGTMITASKGRAVTVGAATVVIPANSLSANTRILVSATTIAVPDSPIGTQIVTGTSYSFSPNGTTFSIQPTLSISYSPANLPSGVAEASLNLYTAVGGVWQVVPGATVNATTHVVSAPLAHFGEYAVLSPTAAANAAAYNIVDCGTLAGDTSAEPTAISSNGIVAGFSYSDPFKTHPFTWKTGTMTQFGFRMKTDDYAKPYGVNASGVAVGTSGQRNLAATAVAFQDGKATTLKHDGVHATASANSITDNGDYMAAQLGAVYSGVFMAFPKPMLTFNPSILAGAMNSTGKIAGSANGWATWDHGTLVHLPIPDGSTSTFGRAVSDSGIVVGQASLFGQSTIPGLIYQNGTTTLIQPLPDTNNVNPYGVNDAGQVVGYCAQGTNFTYTAFLYENGTTKDLNTLVAPSDWHLDQACGINNSGQIVVRGTRGTLRHTFILTPRSH